jgi:hypothetical protein
MAFGLVYLRGQCIAGEGEGIMHEVGKEVMFALMII